MTDALRIQPMSLADLRAAVDWAAAEGWNPGIKDPETFYPVDPSGFLMGWIGDKRATAISVVAHSDDFGFLGFYLCAPEFRGKGYGFKTWQEGLGRLGTRTVGLDGVPAQEHNYRRSGFEFAFRSHRYEGEIKGRAHGSCVPAEPTDMAALIALDEDVNRAARPAFVDAWVQQTDTRRTLVQRHGNRVVAMGTIRRCRVGHKIGPVIAPDAVRAGELIESLVAATGAGRVAIDIPETSDAGTSLAARFGLETSFACARMYKGDVHNVDTERLVGLASFELG
ncbi:MAG: GNAT family N-acetyltransferase [Pseudomonadota bacterium]